MKVVEKQALLGQKGAESGEREGVNSKKQKMKPMDRRKRV